MNILLVEDNQADAYLLTELIKDEPHAPEIHWVTDGHYALDYVYHRGEYINSTQKPDLILLDLGLPRISGYEVLKSLKASTDANIPVIILSTSCDPRDTTQCQTLGAMDYIPKPRNLEGYQVLVQRLMALELPGTA